mmetsp:Transcript_53498/g.122949  ORF Transcript_53498/g.122949 Transcript_53498/m.122949 type:complete len:209 (-) Transcript_53498:2462-3088(-)
MCVAGVMLRALVTIILRRRDAPTEQATLSSALSNELIASLLSSQAKGSDRSLEARSDLLCFAPPAEPVCTSVYDSGSTFSSSASWAAPVGSSASSSPSASTSLRESHVGASGDEASGDEANCSRTPPAETRRPSWSQAGARAGACAGASAGACAGAESVANEFSENEKASEACADGATAAVTDAGSGMAAGVLPEGEAELDARRSSDK